VAACVLYTTGVFAGAYLKPAGGGGRELPRGLDAARLLGRDEDWELDLTVGGLDELRDGGGEECLETQFAVLDCEL